MDELRQEFANAIQQSIDESIKIGYNPTVLIQMLEGEQHSVEIAKKLIISPDTQYGFTRLIELGRPDLTIESILLEERFAPLFTNQHREAARWRLNQAS